MNYGALDIDLITLSRGHALHMLSDDSFRRHAAAIAAAERDFARNTPTNDLVRTLTPIRVNGKAVEVGTIVMINRIDAARLASEGKVERVT